MDPYVIANMCSIKTCVVVVAIVLLVALVINLMVFIQPKTFSFKPDCSDAKVCMVNVTSNFKYKDKVILLETKQSWNCARPQLSFDPVVESCLDRALDVSGGTIYQKSAIDPNCTITGSHLVRALCTGVIKTQSTKELAFRIDTTS